MLFPALGLTAATWLLMGPLMDIETGTRAVLTVGVGGLALVLSLLSFCYRAAGWGVVALGYLVGFANLLMFAPIASFASVATCAVALVAAGAAPVPVVVPVAARAAQPIRTAAPAAAGDRDLPAAA